MASALFCAILFSLEKTMQRKPPLWDHRAEYGKSRAQQ